MNVIPIIKATNITNLRKHMKVQFDNVTDNNSTLIVTRSNNKNIVVIAENTYEEMIKMINNLNYTLKLMKSSKEAEDRDFIEVTFDELGTYE